MKTINWRSDVGWPAALAAFSVILLAGAFSAARAQDPEYPKTRAQALALEKAETMPLTAFYDTPSPLPAGRPSKLIRSQTVGSSVLPAKISPPYPTPLSVLSQAVSGYVLPEGVRAIRILYHSQSATGKDVAASGVVLLPSGSPPKGGWPVIAWAHGTTGVARLCAPSVLKDVGYGNEGLFPMVQAGFAVVATDYAGLGTEGRHQYMFPDAQANDVINAVKAAHEAVAHLSPRWVADGHSEGGGATWFVAQKEAVLRDPNYLGAVSVAGTVNMTAWQHYMAVTGAEDFYAVYTAYGIKSVFPQFDVADMLTKPALARYHALTTRGCWYYAYTTKRDGLLGRLAVKPHFADNPWVRKFLARDNPFRHQRPTRPLLVLAGGADRTVPPQSIQQVVQRACHLGYHLQFRTFPGLDHDPLMYESTPYQLRWIRERFAGQPAPDDCAALIKRR